MITERTEYREKVKEMLGTAGWDGILSDRLGDKGEEVYARPPRGVRVVDPATKVPIVWKMMTPLYGQGDAGLVWFRTIKNQLTREQSFNQSDSDRPVILLEAHVNLMSTHM